MNRTRTIAALGAAVVMLAACASTPDMDPSTVRARAELTALQTDPQLSSLAPLAIKEAETAVVVAEASTGKEDAGHLGYVAVQKVAAARQQAERRLAENNLKLLGDERERVRLEARTREADLAKAQANSARSQADFARAEAERAQREADAARIAAQQQQQAAMTASAQAEQQRRENEELRQALLELEARETDRGMVLTLGDVLFATARADLKPGATARLEKLVSFLNRYPDRTIVIEGHTDSQGSDDYNMSLSQRRADSVRAYLVTQGIPNSRVMSIGKGESFPVAPNEHAAGRQQNRRVEIVIQNATTG